MRYYHYDVFTDRPFEGNQLAVFPDARGLSAAQMQALTREMNFSESTFVLPAETPGTDVRMRIFTPGAELPMAGHPTIGTTFALADEGVIAAGRERFVFGLGVGPTPVELDVGDGASRFCLDGPAARRSSRAPRRASRHRARGGPRPRAPSREPACPSRRCRAARRSSGAGWLRARPSMRRSPTPPRCGACRARFPAATSASSCSVWSPSSDGVTVYARMFAPVAGRRRGPGHGQRHRAARLLLRAARPGGGGGAEIVSLQGVKMGRPSRHAVRITGTRGAHHPRPGAAGRRSRMVAVEGEVEIRSGN